MKKILFTLIAMFAIMADANAMSFAQAREQALFLTDKMAYELNLSEEQYEAAYEINLDYLMNVNTVNDVYADYWRQRNLDLQYILYDWQYSAYCAASYFYRPIYWSSGYWHFGIYAYYPHRSHFYFSRPACYNVYRGGHSWRTNGGRSWYVNRTSHFRPAVHRQHYVGMRDSYRGDNRSSRHTESRSNNRYSDNRNYHNDNNYASHRDNRNYSNNRYSDNNVRYRASNQERSNIENRRSSTRTTVGNNSSNSNRSYNSGNSFNSSNSRRSTFSGNTSRSTGSAFSGATRSAGSTRSTGSFSGGTRSAGSAHGSSSAHSHGGGRR